MASLKHIYTLPLRFNIIALWMPCQNGKQRFVKA